MHTKRRTGERVKLSEAASSARSQTSSAMTSPASTPLRVQPTSPRSCMSELHGDVRNTSDGSEESTKHPRQNPGSEAVGRNLNLTPKSTSPSAQGPSPRSRRVQGVGGLVRGRLVRFVLLCLFSSSFFDVWRLCKHLGGLKVQESPYPQTAPISSTVKTPKMADSSSCSRGGSGPDFGDLISQPSNYALR